MAYDRGFTSSAAKAALTNAYSAVELTGAATLDAQSSVLPDSAYLSVLMGEIDTIASSAASVTWYLALDAAGDRPLTNAVTETITVGATTATKGGVQTIVDLHWRATASGAVYLVAKTNTGTCNLTPRLFWSRNG